MDHVQSKLTSCFATVFPQLPAKEISSASLGNVPGWDSLATITLIALIEEEFQIQTDTTDLERLVSFNSILDYLNERAPGPRASNCS